MILLTPCLTTVGQTKPVQAWSQPPTNAQDDRSQAAGSSEQMAILHSEVRLVLITAGAWKRTADKHPDESLIPADVLKSVPAGYLMFLTPHLRYARRLDTRLTQSDFHVFDNGTEQRIAYFKKTLFPMKDITREFETSWSFYPKIRSTCAIHARGADTLQIQRTSYRLL